MLCYSFFVMGSKSYSQSRTKSSGSRERMMTMDWQSLDPQVPGKQDIEHLHSFGLAFLQYICSCILCIPKLCSGMPHSPKKSKELYSQFIGKMRSVCQLLLEGVHLCCDHHPRFEQVGTTIFSVPLSINFELWMAFKELLQGARFNKSAQRPPIICLTWIDPI